MAGRHQALRSVAVIALAGLAASACDGPTSVASSSTGATPASSSSTTTIASLPLGSMYTAKDGSLTLAVQRVRSKIRPNQVSEHVPAQIGAALVSACVKGGDGRLSWESWTAVDPNGLESFAFGPMGDLPGPFLPSVLSGPVRPGACVTGWVDFELGLDATIAQVRYTHGPDVVSWRAS